jgi:hypothetical protein
MPSHVGTVVVGGFLLENEATTEELGGQHSSSAMGPNFVFEQGKPQCFPILLIRPVLYNFFLQMYYAFTYRI